MTVKIAFAAAVLAALSFPAVADDLAGGWRLESTYPGTPKCRAVKWGGSVDIQLLRNKVGKMVVMAGHPDWNLSFGTTNLTLAVDAEPPVALEGQMVGPLVVILVDDDALEHKIENAATLHWHFTWGDFAATVTGLGAAYAAIPVCPA